MPPGVWVEKIVGGRPFDTEAECGFVLKALRVIEKYPEKRAEWEPKLNPLNLGLAWPGATPHSAGTGCDLILVDAQGRDSFDWRAGVPGTPRSSIDQRLASRMLDEEVTDPAVGAPPQLRGVALRVGRPQRRPLQGPGLRDQILSGVRQAEL